VIYVLGNHEYYGNAYPKMIDELAAATKNTNVFILENNCVLIENTAFVGCTLWTDFELFGNFRQASYSASISMTDFKRIRLSPKYSKLKPSDTAIAHNKSLRWLKEQVHNNNDKNIVVITHHAPSEKSIPHEYKNDCLSPAYASSLDAFIENSGVNLWIHGHTHNQLDYVIGSTRIVCNPRGYPDETNELFDPRMVIEI
jgi:predicted phosphohydrolase